MKRSLLWKPTAAMSSAVSYSHKKLLKKFGQNKWFQRYFIIRKVHDCIQTPWQLGPWGRQMSSLQATSYDSLPTFHRWRAEHGSGWRSWTEEPLAAGAGQLQPQVQRTAQICNWDHNSYDVFLQLVFIIFLIAVFGLRSRLTNSLSTSLEWVLFSGRPCAHV